VVWCPDAVPSLQTLFVPRDTRFVVGDKVVVCYVVTSRSGLWKILDYDR